MSVRKSLVLLLSPSKGKGGAIAKPQFAGFAFPVAVVDGLLAIVDTLGSCVGSCGIGLALGAAMSGAGAGMFAGSGRVGLFGSSFLKSSGNNPRWKLLLLLSSSCSCSCSSSSSSCLIACSEGPGVGCLDGSLEMCLDEVLVRIPSLLDAWWASLRLMH
jgi:hypothetical protein